ncbi:hypothetical protein V8G54_024085 [Vigna mungo]|uniref:Uncharacterized protein n=1 Tax=Vigna mungo TaxID=3915 RepID=A0AAQ3RPT2_VIGMU
MCLLLTCVVNRKIPGGLTEARLSIVAILSMMLLLGMEPCYLAVSASTSVIVYKSSDHYYLRNFNNSFLEVPYGFASNDASDVMGTEGINIAKTVLDSNSRPTGTEFRSGTVTNAVKHDDEVDGESDEGSFSLTALDFDNYVHQYDPEIDGRIILAKVDCTLEADLCRRYDC